MVRARAHRNRLLKATVFVEAVQRSPVLKPPVAVREPLLDKVVGHSSFLHVRHQLPCTSTTFTKALQTSHDQSNIRTCT